MPVDDEVEVCVAEGVIGADEADRLGFAPTPDPSEEDADGEAGADADVEAL